VRHGQRIAIPLDARYPVALTLSGVKHGLVLEYITLARNVVGVGIVFYAAYHARSLALANFGVDSLEIVASVSVVWELAGIHADRPATS